jgi:hypothetical protein
MRDDTRGRVSVVELLRYLYFFFIALEMHTAAPPQVMVNPRTSIMIADVDITDDLPDRKH